MVRRIDRSFDSFVSRSGRAEANCSTIEISIFYSRSIADLWKLSFTEYSRRFSYEVDRSRFRMSFFQLLIVAQRTSAATNPPQRRGAGREPPGSDIEQTMHMVNRTDSIETIFIRLIRNLTWAMPVKRNISSWLGRVTKFDFAISESIEQTRNDETFFPSN